MLSTMANDRGKANITIRLPLDVAARLKEMAYYNHLNITDFLKPFFYDIAGAIPDHDSIVKHQYANMKKGREFYLKMRSVEPLFLLPRKG
jgi:hypothetical protein